MLLIVVCLGRFFSNLLEKIRFFYQKPSLKYAAWQCIYLWTD